MQCHTTMYLFSQLKVNVTVTQKAVYTLQLCDLYYFYYNWATWLNEILKSIITTSD